MGATSNAPVAGALFAVEIILGDFGVSWTTKMIANTATPMSIQAACRRLAISAANPEAPCHAMSVPRPGAITADRTATCA